ncbi:MAG: 4-hydroxythreonine-4-phosphate dehydrogenase PdxA [Planctomycetia bacterium]|nr:4-hydroxythreonine-4-phosphate dehydrogenase PdxA [Planctomycetia bacterium]
MAFVASAVEAVKQGQTDAIVTGPIHKQAIKMAGYPWPGHTELLAEKFGASHVAMMFAGGPFRVVLATIHIPLADVPRSLTTEGVVETICLADDALRKWFGIGKPTIGVLGLNPHASDGGRFGHEEEQIIEPAIREAARRGIAAVGPVVPDVAFRQATEGRFDCLVAMYHDQALIPVKTVAFDKAVNITLGIDCIRTSVDHGTAYDIAGRGVADPSSMKAAIRMAAAMAPTAAP